MTETALPPESESTEPKVATEAGQVTVRPAVLEDFYALRALLKHTLFEVQDGQVSRKINDQKVRAYIELCIGEGACLVAEIDGAVIGTICMRTLQEIWSDDQFLNEEWFCVTPAFRQTGAAFKLLDTAEQLADQMRLPVFFAINNHDPEATEYLMDRRPGYRRTGSNYLRHPRHGQQEVDNDNESGRPPVS